MKVLYATSVLFPTTLGNRLQIIAMAKEFSKILGSSFSLGVLSVSAAFPFKDPIIMGGSFQGFSSRSFILGFRYTWLIRSLGFTHVYCREDKLFICMRLYGLLLCPHTRFFFEAHWAHRFSTRLASRLAHGVVTISGGIRDDLVAAGVPRKRILVAADGIDLTRLENLPPREVIRRELGFGTGECIILYLGIFDYYHPWKGVDVMIEAAEHAEHNWRFVLIGGRTDEIDRLKKQFPRSQADLRGYCPPEKAPLFWIAADVLVIPNKKGDTVSERYTSPMKLFEYMASGQPILASDLPSIREIVSEREAWFFEPNDPQALLDGARKIFADPEEAKARARRARELVAAKYTWDKRARAILSFLTSHNV